MAGKISEWEWQSGEVRALRFRISGLGFGLLFLFLFLFIPFIPISFPRTGFLPEVFPKASEVAERVGFRNAKGSPPQSLSLNY